MSRRTGNGRFQKGESGNPGGRPKLPAEMREMFQTKAPEAFEVLCKHLHASDPRVPVSAATQILDRAYGRPVQSIDVRRMARRFAISPRCPRSLQRRRNGWKASGGRMPGERWSPVSLLLSMTSKRIRRRWVHLTPPPASIGGSTGTSTVPVPHPRRRRHVAGVHRIDRARWLDPCALSRQLCRAVL